MRFFGNKLPFFFVMVLEEIFLKQELGSIKRKNTICTPDNRLIPLEKLTGFQCVGCKLFSLMDIILHNIWYSRTDRHNRMRARRRRNGGNPRLLPAHRPTASRRAGAKTDRSDLSIFFGGFVSSALQRPICLRRREGAGENCKGRSFVDVQNNRIAAPVEMTDDTGERAPEPAGPDFAAFGRRPCGPADGLRALTGWT